MVSKETLKLGEIFEEISKTMKSDFDRSRFAIQIHPGLKGIAAENIVKQFLEHYIPKSLGITEGILVDSTGNRSKQLDIIIYDANKTPVLFKSEGIRVIPVECAYSIIEVKSKLTVSEIPKIFDNMDSVRCLQKNAYYEEPNFIPFKLYGKNTWDNWPINYFVFAFNSIDLDMLVSKIRQKQVDDSRKPHEQIDMICVHEKGVIHYEDNDDYSITPKTTSQLRATKTSKSLLLFYSLISRLLNQMNMKKFTFTPYIKEIDFGS